jgi:hypothetical protein
MWFVVIGRKMGKTCLIVCGEGVKIKNKNKNGVWVMLILAILAGL